MPLVLLSISFILPLLFMISSSFKPRDQILADLTSWRAFVPVGDEPKCAWIDRDEREISKLVSLATDLIDELYRRTTRQPLPPRSEVADAAPRRTREPFRALALAD